MHGEVAEVKFIHTDSERLEVKVRSFCFNSNEAKYLELCILIFFSLPKHRTGVCLRLMHFFSDRVFFHSHLFVGTTKTTIATVASTRFVLSLHDWRDAEINDQTSGMAEA